MDPLGTNAAVDKIDSQTLPEIDADLKNVVGALEAAASRIVAQALAGSSSLADRLDGATITLTVKLAPKPTETK